MRTKAIVTAAVGLCSLGIAMAEVTSENTVGFINLNLKAGYNLIANQLNQPNTANASNHINVVFPDVPVESQLLKWDASVQNYLVSDIFAGAPDLWVNYDSGLPSTTFLNPGEAAFFYLAGGVDKTVTLVGEVPEGDALTVTFPAAYRLASSIVPQQLFLVSSNNFPAALEMQYLTYNATIQNFNTAAIFDGTEWLDYDLGTPVNVNPAVGQGFFLYNSGGPANWTRSFHVQ